MKRYFGRPCLRLLAALVCTVPVGQAMAQTETSRSPEQVHAAWQGFVPRFEPDVCPFAYDTEYDASRVTCGYVLVPEDRTNRDSRLIRIAVMKVAARVDPLPERATVTLVGGPGSPGISAGVAQSWVRSADIGERGDLVMIDQRGIGFSDADFCRTVPGGWQQGAPTMDEASLLTQDQMRRCLNDARRRGIAIDAYSTWHNALDVRDVRKALGYTQWNLLGVSYGGRLAQAVMAVDSDGVRAVVLDSPVPSVFPQDFELASRGVRLRSALTAIDAACAADPDCAADVGSFSERFEAVIASYDADPLTIEGIDSPFFRGGRIVVDGTLAAQAVFRVLYDASGYDDLPLMLRGFEERRAAAGDAFLAGLIRLGGLSRGTGVGMGFVTQCRGYLPEDAGAGLAAEPRLTRWLEGADVAGRRACERAYRVDPDPSVFELESDIPTLVLSGEVDPITPPALARLVLPGLRNATHLTFPFMGHGVALSLNASVPGCGGEILDGFLADPTGLVDADCAEAIPAPEFLTRVKDSRRPMQFLQSIRNGDWPIVPAIVFLALGIAFVAYPVAGLGRLLMGRRNSPFGRIRALAWAGVLLSLTGAAVAAAAFRVTLLEHPAALPFGLVPWAVLAGWLGIAALAAALLAAALLAELWRHNTSADVGTAAGLGSVTLLIVAGFILLVSIGFGPV